MSNQYRADLGEIINARRVEPEKRLVGGVRGHAVHRFPIKGGVSLLDVLRPTEAPFLTAILKRKKNG